MWDEARSDDDRDIGWGDELVWPGEDEAGQDPDVGRLLLERPPHHLDADLT